VCVERQGERERERGEKRERVSMIMMSTWKDVAYEKAILLQLMVQTVRERERVSE
jgi:hypothetical protein